MGVARLAGGAWLDRIDSTGKVGNGVQYEQLYNQLIQLFIAETTNIIAFHVHTDEEADGEAGPTLPIEVLDFLRGTGHDLLSVLVLMTEVIHTFDAEPPFGRLLMRLIVCMIDDSIQSLSELQPVIDVSIAVVRNIARYRGFAELIQQENTLLEVVPRISQRSEWSTTLTAIVGIFVEAALCIGPYMQHIEVPGSTQTLFDHSMQVLAEIPTGSVEIRLHILSQIIGTLHSNEGNILYLERFCVLSGVRLLVDALIAGSEADANSKEVRNTLTALHNLIARTAIAAPTKDYWLLAPRQGNHEYQAMATDAMLQFIEKTNSSALAEHTVQLLIKLFPAHPLYGTSNVVSMFATLRQRFCDLGHQFQGLSIQFTSQMLTVEPSNWFARELLLLSELCSKTDPHGACEIMTLFDNLSRINVYAETMCNSQFIHNIIDLLEKRRVIRQAGHDEYDMDIEVTLTSRILAVIDASCAHSDSCRDSVYNYGLEIFLKLLWDEHVQEMVTYFLGHLVSTIDKPVRVLLGLEAILTTCIPRNKSSVAQDGPAVETCGGNNSRIGAVSERFWGEGDKYELEDDQDREFASRMVSEFSALQPSRGTILQNLHLLRFIIEESRNERLFIEFADQVLLKNLLLLFGKEVLDSKNVLEGPVEVLALLLMCFAKISSQPGALSVGMDAVRVHQILCSSPAFHSPRITAWAITVLLAHATGEYSPMKMVDLHYEVNVASLSIWDHKLMSRRGECDGHTAGDHNIIIARAAPICMVLQLVAVIKTSSIENQDNELVHAVMGCVHSLLSTENNCVRCQSVGLFDTILESFQADILDTSSAFHEVIVSILTRAGKYGMNGRSIRKILSLMRGHGSLQGLGRPLSDILSYGEKRPAYYTEFRSSEDDKLDSSRSYEFLCANWPPTNGFTLAFWFSMYDPQDSQQPTADEYKLCNFRGIGGGDGSSIGISIDRHTGLMTVKLGAQSKQVPGFSYSICEFTKFSFRANTWYHIVVSQEKAKGGSLFFGRNDSQLHLYVNGICRQTLVAPAYNYSQSCQVQCTLGGTYSEPPVPWCLTTLSLLNTYISGSDAFLLYAGGANTSGISEGDLVDTFRQALSSKIISDLQASGAVSSVAYATTQELSTAPLMQRLICFFRADDASFFSVQKDNSDAFMSDHIPVEDAENTSMQMTGHAGFARHMNLVYNCTIRGTATVHCRRGLREALFEVGGIQVLLYKLATVAPVESEQILILRLIFDLVKGNSQNAQSMRDNEGYLLLQSFMRSKRCIIGTRMIALLLHAAFVDGSTGRSIELADTAIATNLDLLRYILFDYAILCRCSSQDGAALFSALTSAVDSAQNLNAPYNITQYRSVDVIPSLLFVFEHSCHLFWGPVVQSMIRIIHLVMSGCQRDSGTITNDITRLMTYLVSSHKMSRYRSRQTTMYSSPAGSNNNSLLHGRSLTTPETSSDTKTSSITNISCDSLKTDDESLETTGPLKPHKSVPVVLFDSDYLIADNEDDSISHLAHDSTDNTLMTPMFVPVAAYPNSTKQSMRRKESFSSFLQSIPSRVTHPKDIGVPSCDWLSAIYLKQQQTSGRPQWSISPYMTWWNRISSDPATRISVRLGVLRLLLHEVYVNAKHIDVTDIVDVNSLLALCDSKDDAVRVTVVHLIDFLLRLRGSFCAQFENSDGFRVLANQLQQHIVTEDIFVAVANICTGQFIPSSKNDIPSVNLPCVFPQTGKLLYWVLPLDTKDKDRHIDRGHAECISILMSLVITAAQNPSLCINILYTIHNIFIVRAEFRNKMIDLDIIQTICAVLASAQTSCATIYVNVPHDQPSASTPAQQASSIPVVGSDDEYDDEMFLLLLSHAEALLMDITIHVCAQMKQRSDKTAVPQIIENIVDFLSNWGLAAEIVQRLQRTVLSTALNQLFSNYGGSSQIWKLWGLNSRPKQQISHPAQMVCYLAVDAIIFSDWVTLGLNLDSEVQDQDTFICSTFNALKIIILHDGIQSHDLISDNTELLKHFGRLLLFIFNPARSQTVHEFAITQLAENLTLYDVVLNHITHLTKELLHLMTEHYYSLRESKKAVDVSLRNSIREGLTHIIKSNMTVQRQLIDVRASNLASDAFQIAFIPSEPAEEHAWSYYFDCNRSSEIEARGIRKCLDTQSAMESKMKIGINAVDITSNVLEARDKHMKLSLQRMQENQQSEFRIKKRWQSLASSVHQRGAAWSQEPPESVWILDPSEGPLRMRKRLTRTPRIRDVSNLSRSPQKADSHQKDKVDPPLKDASARKAAAKIPILGALDEISHQHDHEYLLDAYYKSLCHAFEILCCDCDFTHLQTLDPFDQYTMSLQLAKDHGDGVTIREVRDLDLPSIAEIRELWDKQYFVKIGSRKDVAEYLTREAPAGDTTLGGGLLPGDHLTEVSMCKIVTPFCVKEGEILIGREAFYFKEDMAKSLNTAKNRSQQTGVVGLGALLGDPGQLPSWKNTSIREVHERRYLLQQNALEIFLLDGTTLFFAFSTKSVRDNIKQKILALVYNLPNYVDYSNTVNGSLTRDSITAQWAKGSMSNFEYLMHVNKLAGRSFNDLTQYPVFPFVLKDYTSEELDLDNPAVYRDLRKPMGAQNEERLQKFIRRFKDLIELGETPYHYGSHYSSIGSVLHLLVRLEPFTQLFIELQGGRFDFADRTFYDIAQTWDLSSRISSSDVKELIPELFYLPECLVNLNNCPFGVKQDGVVVDDVVLPPWARGSARTFIDIHRRALESDYVSANLNHWIDLIFGAKQEGQAAAQAFNSFLPASYEGAIDIDAIEDSVEREAQWAIVRSFGQTPKKLLMRPHVQRQSRSPLFMLHDSQGDPPTLASIVAVPYRIHSFFREGEKIVGLSAYEQRLQGIQGNYIVTWNAWDRAVRVVRILGSDSRKEVARTNELHDDVPMCVATLRRNVIIVGGRSGLIYAYSVSISRKNGRISPALKMQGHVEAVTTFAVADEFSVLVSGSVDGAVMVWDINSFSLVHVLPVHKGPICCLAVSNSTGDFVTVCRKGRVHGMGTKLYLWSINGTQIATGDTDVDISAVCMSDLSDGLSSNIVATGMSDGSIRLWDSQDLRPLRSLVHPLLTTSICTIELSPKCTYILAGTSDLKVFSWMKNHSRQEKSAMGVLDVAAKLAFTVTSREGHVSLA